MQNKGSIFGTDFMSGKGPLLDGPVHASAISIVPLDGERINYRIDSCANVVIGSNGGKTLGNMGTPFAE